MAEFKEVRVERLYVKVPNTDKLRKTAAGRHRYLLATGWREMDRKLEFDHVTVRYERTGHTPLKSRLPKVEPEVQRMDRRPRGQFGGGGGRGFGGRGGGRGGPRGGAGGRGGPGAGRGAGGRGVPPQTGPQPGGRGASPQTGAQPSGGPTQAGPPPAAPPDSAQK